MNYAVPFDSKSSTSSETKLANPEEKLESFPTQGTKYTSETLAYQHLTQDKGSEEGTQDSVTEFEELEKEVSNQVRTDSRSETIDSPRSEPDSESLIKVRNSKVRLVKPTEEPMIAGPMDVALSLNSIWKRRFITVVGDGLYIWTNHR